MNHVKVEDISVQVRGVSYNKSEVRTAPAEGYSALLRGGNIGAHGLILEDLQYVPIEKVSEKQKLRNGDVVLVASSGSLDAVGKAAAIDDSFAGTFGAFCKVLRPSSKVDQRYFAHYFKTSRYRRTVSSLAAGANINNLKNEHLNELEFPLPTLSEQRRIADILDKADALRTKRRESIGHLDALTQSIFHEMSAGSTAPKRVLGEVASFHAGGTLPDGEVFVGQPGGYLLARVSDMNRPGNESDLVRTAEWTPEIRTRGSLCPAGGVVFPKRGASIATNKKRLAVRPTVLDPNLMGVAPGPLLDSTYLLTWFSGFDLASISSGSSVPQLNKKDLAPLELPVPNLERQLEFAGRVAAIERLKATHRAQLAELDNLLLSLQDRAYKGHL